MLFALGVVAFVLILALEGGSTRGTSSKEQKSKRVDRHDSKQPQRTGRTNTFASSEPSKDAGEEERHEGNTNNALEGRDDERAIALGRQSVRAAIKARAITSVFHFTRAENLDSILKFGLIMREELEKNETASVFNDDLRLDNRKRSISLSVSFPNHLMLCRLRREMPNNRWVVLEMPASVLWGFRCAFFPHNAADKRMSKLSLATQLGPEALESMFINSDMESLKRERQTLFECDPTDSQAEVLLLENLPIDRIKNVIFNDVETMSEFQRGHSSAATQLDASYFDHRERTRKWQSALSTSRNAQAAG